MNSSNKKNPHQKLFQKPLTQLTVKHFFTPISNPTKTLKKLIKSAQIPDKIQEESPTNEELIEKLDEFLAINEKKTNQKPFEIYPDEIDEKKTKEKSIKTEEINDKNKPNSDETPDKNKENFDENSNNSTNNSKFADILLNNYLKDQQEEKQKILQKPSNLFQISEILTNSSEIPSFILDKFPKNPMNFPYILLILTHQLYCKNLDFFVFLSGKWQNLTFFPFDLFEIFFMKKSFFL